MIKSIIARIYRRLSNELCNRDPIAWMASQRELHKLFALNDIDAIIDAAAGYRGYGYYRDIRPRQVPEEVAALARLIREKQPSSVLEIGAFNGGTLFIWCRVAREAKKIVSIDLPGGEFGGGYHPKRERLYKEFIADCPSTEMVLLRVDSQTESARDAAAQALENYPLDFLFIDGDHRYEGVRRDFELYEPLVAPGGIIAFHDIIALQSHSEYGVTQLWHEVKGHYEHQEFIHDPNQGKMGIGVLIKDI